MTRLRISIALATFNGGDFLNKQLQSYLTQTLLPVELVACDDGSTDHTLDTLRSFARTAPFEVRVVPNEARLGPVKNFAKAIALCRGDLIMLSDQDDVWDPVKIYTFERSFRGDPGLGALFCNAEIVDEQLRGQGRDVWSMVDLTGERRRRIVSADALPVLLKRYSVQGATLAFRSTLVPSVLPIPNGWLHDAWIALIAASVSNLRGIPDRLQVYRQHRGNVVGSRSSRFAEQLRSGWHTARSAYYADEIAKFSALRERLQDQENVPDSTVALVTQKIEHLRRRAAFPHNALARWPYVARELATGGYRRFATDWRSVALDIVGR